MCNYEIHFAGFRVKSEIYKSIRGGIAITIKGAISPTIGGEIAPTIGERINPTIRGGCAPILNRIITQKRRVIIPTMWGRIVLTKGEELPQHWGKELA